MPLRITVLGAGIFGLAAAWEFGRRGHRVRVLDPAPLLHEKAASTDLSKGLRHAYGEATALYAPLVREARAAWLGLEAQSGRRIFHQVGALHLATRLLAGSFEQRSLDGLRALGHPVEVWDAARCARALPGFDLEGIELGLHDPEAGWLDPPQALLALRAAALAQGCRFEAGAPALESVRGESDLVLLAAGAWLARLLPAAAPKLRLSRQHEALLAPGPSGRTGEGWPFWSLDLATLGFYGFPLHPSGHLKLACHRPGPDGDPDGDRGPVPEQARAVQEFLRRRIPGLNGLPDLGRSCFYTLCPDHAWIIDAVPGEPGLFVAGAGGGHAFKFGPVLGRLTASAALDGRTHPAFAWDRPASGLVV
jgi:glycine/D-amino acid oxidase-like deaminating enzyme